MSEELKPCPFCGGEAQIDREHDDRGNQVIECRECFANVGANLLSHGIERWNLRATPPAPSTSIDLHNRIVHRLGWLERGHNFNVTEFVADVRQLLGIPPQGAQGDPMPSTASEVGPGSLVETAVTRMDTGFQGGPGTASEDERAAFEKSMNDARFFPAELSFWRTTSPSGRDEYENGHLESCWIGWQARAALAKPSTIASAENSGVRNAASPAAPALRDDESASGVVDVEAERKLFEEAAKREPYAIYAFTRFGASARDYLDTKTEAAWRLWQARAAATPGDAAKGE